MTTQDWENQVIQKLRLLAAVPEPDLSAGRRRFLEAAMQMAAVPPNRAPHSLRAAQLHGADWIARLLPRPRPAFAALAVVVLLAAITMSVAAMMVEWTSPATSPQLATPALSPTFTATPTRMVGAALPGDVPMYPVSAGTPLRQLIAPRQCPTPDPAGHPSDPGDEFADQQQISIAKWHSVNG